MAEIWDLYNLDGQVVGEHVRGNEMPEDAYHLKVGTYMNKKF